jgi:parallel beta-helix repeat protein
MLSRTKLISIIISTTILITNLAFADWRENAKAIKVSGGENHTLVLTTNKWPWGCGFNEYFQLGIGNTTADQLTLVRVHDGDMNTPSDCLEDINDIAAGWKHSLALDVNGLVWAWGDNGCGQLGNNGFGWYQTAPVQVHGVNDVNYLKNIIAISAGRSGQHSLAVDANGFAFAWGYNYYGQCGNGESGGLELVPVKVVGPDLNHNGIHEPNEGYLENIVAVSAGLCHSLGLENLDPNDSSCKGRVYTWGNDTAGSGNTPIRILKGEQDTSTSEYLENIVAVSAGWYHSMALEDYNPFDPNCKGRVYTWGYNVDGILGDGTTTTAITPVFVLSGEQNPNNPSSYLKGIIAVGAGEGHSTAMDVNGLVYTWGNNSLGQLGNGTYDPCTVPVRVVGPDLNHNGIHEPNEGYLGNIVAISAGFWHCLAIDADGAIWTWGYNDYGQLGLGDAGANRNIPHRIPVVYNVTQETFHFRIQNAIDDASNGDVIEASTGTYYEAIDFLQKNITVRSTNPNNPGIVADTIIDGSNHYDNLITLEDNPGSTIAGFTITNGNYWSGIYSKGSSPTITHNTIKANNYDGVYCDGGSPTITHNTIQQNDYWGIVCINNSSPDIKSCSIQNNTNGGIACQNSALTVADCIIAGSYGYSGDYDYYGCGVYCESNSSVDLTNSVIRFNGNCGIYLNTMSSATIKNNWIHNNGPNNYGDGIYIYNSVPAIIRNNTIVNNKAYGIYLWSGTAPDISNCIIWGNNNDTNQLYGCSASYSCIQNGNTNNHNINTDPNFMNPDDQNDLHLDPNSPCIDKGDPNADYNGETDIDGENRIIDGDSNGTAIVDIGADEYYWIVNFFDYAEFANAWRSTLGESNYNDIFDLEDDGFIDYADLAIFCEDWLSQAGWARTLTCGVGRGMIQSMGWSMSQTMTAGFAPAESSLQSILAEQQIEKVEPFKIEQLIKWLEELWLDEETQKVIDKDAWLKLIESLKEEL